MGDSSLHWEARRKADAMRRRNEAMESYHGMSIGSADPTQNTQNTVVNDQRLFQPMTPSMTPVNISKTPDAPFKIDDIIPEQYGSRGNSCAGFNSPMRQHTNSPGAISGQFSPLPTPSFSPLDGTAVSPPPEVNVLSEKAHMGFTIEQAVPDDNDFALFDTTFN